MKARLVRLVTGVIGVATLFMLAQMAIAAEIPRMTKEELKAKLDNPDVVIVERK